MKKLIQNVLKGDHVFFQLIRYTFVGGLAFVVDFGTLYVLTEYFGVYYLISAACAFMLGLAANYVLSIKFVFQKRSVKSKAVEFVIFALVGVIGLGLNELTIWFFTEVMAMYYLLSKIISTAIVYFWNFFVRKYTLFK